jgi:hypothetical protein
MSPTRASSLLGALLLLGCFGEAPAVDACQPIEDPEPMTDCPAICNDGCAENECQIACRADQPCNGPIQCPMDFACDVDCSGDGVCTGATIACPSDFTCSLTCEGANACMGVEMTCGFSECSIECGAPENACDATTVHCGAGACLGECIPGVSPTFDHCEDACACEPC